MVTEKYYRCSVIGGDILSKKLQKRDPDGHKGSFGTLFCLWGSYGMAGAAIISIRAALRCGVELVKAGIPNSIYGIVASNIPEAVFIPLPCDENGVINYRVYTIIEKRIGSYTAILVGCGLGKSLKLDKVIYRLIKSSNVPLIVNADGINSVSENIDILSQAKSTTIITPHMGEMSRPTGARKDKTVSNRFQYTSDFRKGMELSQY